jgi:very-short-patch-repair endonuclease
LCGDGCSGYVLDMVRTPEQTARARKLRRAMTRQEVRLWLYLRTLRAEGFHFRRQAPLKGFIVDFVCFGSRLIIEADGWQHDEDMQGGHDAMRDAMLARDGFRTLRFSNGAIDREMDGVVEAIRRALGIRDYADGPLAHLAPPIPPLHGEGG